MPSRKTKKQTEILLKEAQKLFNNNKTELGIEKLEDILKIDEKNIEIIKKIGDLYLSSGKYKNAIDKFSAAIQIAPNDPVSYFQRGCAYLFLNNSKNALPDFIKAKELGLHSLDIDINIANCLRRLDKASEAYDILIKLKASHPNNKDIYFNLGLTYLCLNDEKSALEHLIQAQKLKYPGTMDLNASLAETHRRMGNLDKTLEFLKKALAVCKEPLAVAGIEEEIGKIYYDMNDFENAVNHYEIAIKINQSSVKCLVNLSACYISLGDYTKAKKCAVEVFKLKPNDEKALRNWLLADKNESTPSKTTSRKNRNLIKDAFFQHRSELAIDPKILSEYFDTGITYLAKNNYAKAISYFTTVNQSGGFAYRELGIAYHLNGNLDDALIAYVNAFTTLKNKQITISTQHYYERGIIYLKLKKFAEAASDFNHVQLHQTPEDAINLEELENYSKAANQGINETKPKLNKETDTKLEGDGAESELQFKFN